MNPSPFPTRHSTASEARPRLTRRAAAFLPGLLGLLAGLGCGSAEPESAPVLAAGGSPGNVEQVGASSDALKAAPVCLQVRRGADGAVADTMINSEPGAQGNNYGATVLLFAGVPAGTQRQSLFRWDLSSIPPTATVLSAGVTLNLTSTGPGTPRVHLITGPWNENTVTWASFAGAFNPTVLTSFSNGFPATPAVSFNILPTAKGWVSGAIPNHGLLLEQAASTVTRTRSSEWGVASQRPQLNICYQITCDTGFADCDGNGKNGCEASLGSPLHCGACGNVCAPLPHATAGCAAGACGIGACDPGFGDCDGNPQNGCETPTNTLGNCGGCGITCDDDGNACTDESCDSGACEHPPVADGAACDDGNGCTAADACVAGACAGTSTDGAPCATNLPGPCAAGSTVCVADQVSCVPTTPAVPEVCGDGIDNDCNGSADDACGPTGFNVLSTMNISHGGKHYLALKVELNSATATGATWCDDYTTLCTSRGMSPTGCGAPFVNQNDGYGACRTDYQSEGLGDTLGCNPSGGVAGVLQSAGFSDADSNNSFAFHYCDADTCQKTLCDGDYCDSSLSYIDASQPFAYTLCVASPTCADGLKNGDETGFDCGGSSCAPCQNLCADGVEDSDEIGVDCGGSFCAPCVCTVTDTCADGVQNGDEVGVDCGGRFCASCACPAVPAPTPPGNCPAACTGGCAGGVCAIDCSATQQCIGNQINCPDGMPCQVNCGGIQSCISATVHCPSDAPCDVECTNTQTCINANVFCPDAAPCTLGSSGNVSALGSKVHCGNGPCNGVCGAGFNWSPILSGCEHACGCNNNCTVGLPSPCQNGKKDAGEQGIDCGGSCVPCTCLDGARDCTETGTDCGGSCGDCPVGQGCATSADCSGVACVNHVCAPPSCTDAFQNGGELGVDCGGGACPGCALDSNCNQNADCASNFCSPMSWTCTPGCVSSDECNGNPCVAGVCIQPSCNDGLQNQDETSVDCGGSTCPGCADGQPCNQDSDCASNVCNAGLCVDASACIQTLTRIWGAADNDIYAVGQGGKILHYDGAAWSPMNSGTVQNFLGVSGTSGSDIWAVGEGVLSHYDGQAWTTSEPGGPPDICTTRYDVWGAAPNAYHAGHCGGYFIGYDGATWEYESVGGPQKTGIGGCAANDIWATDEALGWLVHYDGSTWDLLFTPPGTQQIGRYGVACVASNDVYMVGVQGDAIHYDGTAWTTEPTGVAATLREVADAGAKGVVAVGDGGTLLHRQAGTWSSLPSGTGANLRGAWVDSTGLAWIVGDGCTLLSVPLP